MKVPTLGFSPTPDAEGGVLPEHPAVLRERGEFTKVPLLTGRTSGEFAIVVDIVGMNLLLKDLLVYLLFVAQYFYILHS